MKKNPLVGVVAGIIIILCGIYIGTTIRNSDWLTPQTAASINSQLPASSKAIQNKTLSAQELYSIVKQLNTEIEKTVSGTEIIETKTIQPSIQKSVSTGGSVAVPQATVQATKSDDSVKGVATGPIDQEKLHRQLIERKNFLILLAKADPRLFLLSSLSGNVLAKIRAAFRLELEKDVTITGIVDVLHYDDFDHEENSYFEYFITSGKERLSLYPTEDLPIISGSTFKITGKKIGDIFVAENKDIEKIEQLVQTFGPTPPPDSVGDQKTLVILIRFQDSPYTSFSQQQADDLIFKGNFQKFYKEQSYGKTSFSGRVVGWYNYPRNCNSQNALLDILTPGSQTQAFILNNHIRLDGYSRLLLVAQGDDTPNCYAQGFGTAGKVILTIGGVSYKLSVGWVGVSNSSLAQINQNNGVPPTNLTFFERSLFHEVGHNLGLVHANGLDCGENTLDGDCQHIEYGNLFDAMGGAFYALHFNAFYKELLGWVSPQNEILITQSGRYTINPIEVQKANQKNLAKIQRLNSTSTPFYLELKKGIGWDGWLNDTTVASNQRGLIVNLVRPYPLNPFPQLLDMQPTSLGWYTGDILNRATLNVGELFTDPSRGITIGPVINVSSSTITFDVNIQEPVCIRGNPKIGQVNYSQIVGAGGGGYIQIPFENGDSIMCGESKFNVTLAGMPSSWQLMFDPPGDIGLRPKEYDLFDGLKSVNFSVPQNATSGIYPITYSVINRTTGNSKINQINIEVVQPPIIYDITPRSGPVGTNAIISGLNFSSNPTITFYGTEPTSGYFSANLPSNGSNVNFQIPPFLTGYNCNCSIPTTLGVYNVVVGSSGAFSNTVQFEVTQ